MKPKFIFQSALLAVALISFWVALLTESPIEKDAGDNLWMAINWNRASTMSVDPQLPANPSMDREPVPALAIAAALRVLDAFKGPADPPEYFHGERAKLLKLVNCLWLGLLTISIFALARKLRLSRTSAFVCILIVNLLLLSEDFGFYMLDSLFTEAPAAALLTLGSWLLAVGIPEKRIATTALGGICFGLLALVKASFLYVALGVVVAIPLAAWLCRRRDLIGTAWRHAAIFAIVCGAIVTPWMLRNYALFNQFSIATRGGLMLHTRAVMDQMPAREYVGAFMVYAQYPLNGALRRLLGYSREDLQNGAYLQRLDERPDSPWAASDLAAENAGEPDKAVTYYRYSRAYWIQIAQRFEATGSPNPETAADRVLQREAVSMITAHPWRHLALTLPFLWRGAFFSFPILMLGLFLSWRNRSYPHLLMILPALGTVLFYATVSFFIPRYDTPMVPIVVCMGAMFVGIAYETFHTWRSRFV